MNPVDIILILVIAALITLAVFLALRRRKTSSCCGSCDTCKKKNMDNCKIQKDRS